MSEVNAEVIRETCPVCGVIIENGAKVIFSCGPAGTKERLWARVCNYAQNSSCLLWGEELKPITDNDKYD